MDDWERVRSSSYIYTGNAITDAQAGTYDALGFEVSIHVDTGCADWAPAQLEAYFASQLAGLAAKLPSIPPPTTERNHCITWSDWTTQADVELAHGIRLDTNYYFWPPDWVNNTPGVFTGSGMPMRFATLDGSMIDVYQVATQMTDESGQSYPFTANTLLDRALGAEGYYGAFCANIHTDSANNPAWAPIVASAQSRGVPVIAARQLLRWLDARQGSSFANLSWAANTLSFDLVKAASALNLEAMLPVSLGGMSLQSLTVDAASVTTRTETIKGVEYAIFDAVAGAYAASYAIDETAPVISALTATANNDGTAEVTWSTDEPATSLVDYGTDSGTLNLNESAGALVTDHALTLTGLSPNTIYYYRATSQDGAGNSATLPVPPATADFTTPPPICFTDATVADFALGSGDAGIHIGETADGELMLAPTEVAEFEGTALPAGWDSGIYAGGSPVAVAAGVATLAAAWTATTTLYSSGHSLEFVATFGAAPHQYVGFGTDLNGPPWVIFGTNTSGAQLEARTNMGTSVDVGLGTSYFGSPHTYRIDWSATEVVFWIDGSVVNTETASIAGPMRPIASDLYFGDLALTVDWMRMSPYAAAGSFTSRVYNALGTADWGNVDWAADEPAGTSIDIQVRQGDTPTPNGSWTTFAAVMNGGPVEGSSQYIQYRAILTSTDDTQSPRLLDLSIGCVANEDTNPPVIMNLAVNPAAAGTSATISWDTDEPADSKVDYGTSQGDLNQSLSDAGLVLGHLLELTGLTPGTDYYFRVSSADALANSTTEPSPPADPAHFWTPDPGLPPCLVESTVADFNAGTVGAGIAITEIGDGELILAPALGSEFDGSTLPTGWLNHAWPSGGSVTVSGGKAIADGALTAPNALYTQGRSLEFVATFGAEFNQHAGFADGIGFNRFAMFSTSNSTTTLYARTTNPTTLTPLTGDFLGTPHRYRIDWLPGSTVFSIDGAVLHTTAAVSAGDMQPVFSDYTNTAGAVPLTIDWMRMSPYQSSGSFSSAVFDAGEDSNWGVVDWLSSVPAGTGLAVWVRTGDAETVDDFWTAYAQVASPGNVLGGNSRYLQYRVDLSATDLRETPVFESISIDCQGGPDLLPPEITDLQALPGPLGETAAISWTTNEPATGRVDYGPAPETLNQSMEVPAYTTAHTFGLVGLTPGSTYFYRVTSVDPDANSTTQPAPPDAANFTTPYPPCAVDATTADFAAGTLAGTYIAAEGDGLLMLAPAEGSEFAGPALPPGWTQVPWSAGGGVSFSGGGIIVDGTLAAPGSLSGSGHSLEFVATFGPEPFQHVGFADNFSTNLYAIFSTRLTTTTLYARTAPGNDEVSLGTGYIGAPHRFRIDWTATQVVYSIDGTVVHTESSAIAASMRPVISDANPGSSSIAVDWLRMTPYAANGSFDSRIFDAGSLAYWDAISWNADVPVNTSLGFQVRTGNEALPDGSWSAFGPVIAASGDPVGLTGRYLQYRALLATGDTGLTPALEDVSFTCGTCAGTPAALSVLTATPRATGNPAGQTVDIELAWPAQPPGNDVLIYRKPFGAYPVYEGTAPETPASPTAAESDGWTLVAATPANSFSDHPGSRDYWHYVAFVANPCGEASTASNPVGALSYHLGDIYDGANHGTGDNLVNGSDITELGAAYGSTTADVGIYLDYADIGPTVDGSVLSRPMPDGAIQFEDLIFFAINYSHVGRLPSPPPPARANQLALMIPALPAPGERFTVTLRMSGDGSIQGLSAALRWNTRVLQPESVAVGELLAAQGGPSQVFSPAPGQVDAVLLSARNQGISGEGVLATLDFRVLAVGDPGLGLGEILARGSDNRARAIEAAVLPAAPAATRLRQNGSQSLQPEDHAELRPGQCGSRHAAALRRRGAPNPDARRRGTPGGLVSGRVGRPRRAGPSLGDGCVLRVPRDVGLPADAQACAGQVMGVGSLLLRAKQRARLEEMGGRLRLENHPAGGAVARLSLPAG